LRAAWHGVRPGGRRLHHHHHGNYLAQLGAWVTNLQGIIFVICVLTFRRGRDRRIGQLPGKPL